MCQKKERKKNPSEIQNQKEFLAVGKACKAIFWSTLGLNEPNVTGFSAAGSFISVSTRPHHGIRPKTTGLLLQHGPWNGQIVSEAERLQSSTSTADYGWSEWHGATKPWWLFFPSFFSPLVVEWPHLSCSSFMMMCADYQEKDFWRRVLPLHWPHSLERSPLWHSLYTVHSCFQTGSQSTQLFQSYFSNLHQTLLYSYSHPHALYIFWSFAILLSHLIFCPHVYCHCQLLNISSLLLLFIDEDKILLQCCGLAKLM